MIYVTSKWLLSASVVSLAFTFGNSMQHCANVITDFNYEAQIPCASG
jgi:hypothetical protein